MSTTYVSGEVLKSENGVQTLRCRNCLNTWERPSGSGRPPKYCDKCRLLGRPLRHTKRHEPETTDTPVKSGHHREFDTLLAVCHARVPAMLVGPAASGKTTASRQVAEALNLPFYTESCNPQMSKWDLFGFVTASGDYHEGVIYRAFKSGGVVLLDEIDASNPAVLVAINAVAASREGEEFTFPNGENVPRHADFILVAGGNTHGDGASDQYVGREVLDAATLDRFAVINWGYDSPLEYHAAQNDDWVRFVQGVRAAAARANVDMLVTPRASINGAKLLTQGMPRKTVENLTVWKGLSADQIRSVRKELEPKPDFR